MSTAEIARLHGVREFETPEWQVYYSTPEVSHFWNVIEYFERGSTNSTCILEYTDARSYTSRLENNIGATMKAVSIDCLEE